MWFTDGNMLRIKCEEVETALRATEQSLAKLYKLLYNKPIEYVTMALSGEMQIYCDIEDEMVKGMFGTSVQGYLKKRYSKFLIVDKIMNILYNVNSSAHCKRLIIKNDTYILKIS